MATSVDDGDQTMHYVTNEVVGTPIIVRGVCRYRRELGIGAQFYQVKGSDSDKETFTEDVGNDVPPTVAVTVADTDVGEGAGDTIENKIDLTIRAIDLYYLQNIARTAESNYDLVGGLRWASTSSGIVATNTNVDVTAQYQTIDCKVTGRLFGPHIGITGKRRFLIDPLSVTAALTASLLKDTRIEKTAQSGVVSRKIDPVTLNEPVQVIEAEVALRFTSPRLVGMGASIGFLTSQWENVGLATAAGAEGEDLSASGWRAGLNFSF